ncbi:MAG: hypothetical protein ACKOYP_05240 [Bacteroidota bacterium]
MNRPGYLFSLLLLTVVSCTSGKKALEHGNYYQAVLEAVERLRSSPENKRAVSVLRASYPMAVEYLDKEVTDAKTAGDPDQWRKAVKNYQLINTLYEEIRRSPAALRVIAEPQQRFAEIAAAKNLAAEESYQAGLASMLKGTRDDSKRAFQLFTQTLQLVPEYKEAAELSNQAREDATLNVVVEPVIINRPGWNLEGAVYGYRDNQFVRFYSAEQARQEGLKRTDHYLSMAINNFVQSFPSISRSTSEYTDSVKTGERKVGDKVSPVYTRVKSRVTVFNKTVQASAAMKLVITDATSKGTLADFDIVANQTWNDQWIIHTGDARALPRNLRLLIDKKEIFPSETMLRGLVRQELERKLAARVAGFYRAY